MEREYLELGRTENFEALGERIEDFKAFRELKLVQKICLYALKIRTR